MTVLAIFAIIMAGYGLCLLWALRNESARHVAVLALLVGVAVVLRVAYPHTYPWGYHEDELKIAIASLEHYCSDLTWGELPNNMQASLYAAMIGPAYDWFGLWWSIRAYSLLSTTLAVALAYGIGRELRLRPGAAMAGCALPFAVLPWALLYGRSGIGGEVVLNGLVVLFAVLKCRTARGWQLVAATLLLWFGLMLCLFSYTAAKIFLVIAAVSALTFPANGWWRRAAAVAIAGGAAAAIYNSIAIGEHVWYGFSASVLRPELRPQTMVFLNWRPVIAFLWSPLPPSSAVAQSLPWVHVLPLPVVAAVLAGMLLALRRRTTWLLLIAFGVGLLPALLGPDAVSARRLLPAAIVVPFFLGLAVDVISWKKVRVTVLAGLALTLSIWGPARFFSERNWTPGDKFQFCIFGCPWFPPGSPSGEPLRYGPLPAPRGCIDYSSTGERIIAPQTPS